MMLPRRSVFVGQLPPTQLGTRQVGVGETVPRGTRLIIATARPMSAGADWRLLESIHDQVPALEMHPSLRGFITPSDDEMEAAADRREALVEQFGEQAVASSPTAWRLEPLSTAYAAFEVLQDLPASEIVGGILRAGQRLGMGPDTSFSISYSDLATQAELSEENRQALRDAVRAIPLVGPLDDFMREPGKAPGLGLILGVAAFAVGAYLLSRMMGPATVAPRGATV